MFVKPAEGLIVRVPGTGQIVPGEGMEVPETQYWRRRLRDGDVVAAAKRRPQRKGKTEAAAGGPATEETS